MRHLPVVEEERLVGIITHRDLLGAVARLAEGSNGASEQRKSIAVRSIMRRDVTAIGPDMDVRDAIETMLDHKYGCLPVVEHDRLVGIVTEADFLKFTRLLLNTEANRENPDH